MCSLSLIISLDLLCCSHFRTRTCRKGIWYLRTTRDTSFLSGPRVSDKIVKQRRKIKTMPYRPQGNSVSERVYLTLHATLSMYGNIVQNNGAEVLPLIPLAHNTSCKTIMHKTPFFLMFGRQAKLPIDIIFGIPHVVGRSTITEKFAHSTRENLEIVLELARRNVSERNDKQKVANSKLPSILGFTPELKYWSI